MTDGTIKIGVDLDTSSLQASLQGLGGLAQNALQGVQKATTDSAKGFDNLGQRAAEKAKEITSGYDNAAGTVRGVAETIKGALDLAGNFAEPIAAVTGASGAAVAAALKLGAVGTGAVGEFTAKAVEGAGNAKIAFYNMGVEAEKAGENFRLAQEKAGITDGLITEWQALKTAVSDNNLPAQTLVGYYQRIKEIEAWFVDNYGAYITAEALKKDASSETAEALRAQAEQLSEIQRLELERELLNMSSDISDKLAEVEALTTGKQSVKRAEASSA